MLRMLPFLLLAAPLAAADKPNIVLILVDDLGYADIGVQGAKHKTPNIDKLSAEGTRLTNFYTSSSVCTPTRTSIMTGCYPQRVGMHVNEKGQGVLFPANTRGISEKELLLPEQLRKAGYATAIVGKWHLGDQQAYLPTRHGFDTYFGIPFSNDMGQTERPKGKEAIYPKLPLMKDDKVIETEPDQRFLTQRYTDFALEWLAKNKERPFFLYYPTTMPHFPHFSSEAFAGKSGNGKYGDTVIELDHHIGRLMQGLKKHGLDEKTIVIFLSDNGGPVFQGANNSPLRGAKASSWEGGHRVPFIARQPGRIPAGKVSADTGVSFDLYTTLLKQAGAEVPADRIVDGRDLWPVLAGEAKTPHEAFFYYHQAVLHGVRSGPWKLLVKPMTGGKDKKDEAAKPMLFNLEKDIGEKENVYAANPEVVKRLEALLENCREDLGDGPRKGKNFREPGSVEKGVPLTDF